MGDFALLVALLLVGLCLLAPVIIGGVGRARRGLFTRK